MMENYYIVSDQQIFDKLRATADRYRNLALHLNERRWRNVKLRAETQATADRRLELLERALPYLVDYEHLFEGDTIEDLNMLSYFIEEIEKELDDTALGS